MSSCMDPGEAGVLGCAFRTLGGFFRGAPIIIRCVALPFETRLTNWRDYARLFLLCGSCVLASVVAAQQGAATGEPLVIRTVNLPKAYLRQHYETRLQAQGGVMPLSWEVTEGALPAGVMLSREGVLNGAPSETGEFRFVVTVTDSGKPAYQKKQPLVLTVVAPLLARWGRYPKVNGQRVEGSIVVSNQTEQDFDLTMIALAVNEIGRATAIGYQHFSMKKNTTGVEIPFGDNLPNGTYELNVDAVAEVEATNSVYRARLAPKEKLQVQQGP